MEIQETIDNERWLMNNGLISDSAKNNIYVYAYLVNKGITAAEVDINPESKTIYYNLYVKDNLLKAYNYYSNRDDSWFSLIKSAYYVRKYGNLNFKMLLTKFVKDYMGPSWKVNLSVKKSSEYK
jgi:hypothetical protein